MTVHFLSGSTQPHFTMERAERSITNNIDEEVEYATVNELVNVCFDAYHICTLTFQHFVVSNEEEEDRLAGYETIKRLPPTKEAKVKCYIVEWLRTH